MSSLRAERESIPLIFPLFFPTRFLKKMRQQPSGSSHVNTVLFTKLFQHHPLFSWDPHYNKRSRDSIIYKEQKTGGNKHPRKHVHHEDCVHGMTDSPIWTASYELMVDLKLQSNAPFFIENVMDPEKKWNRKKAHTHAKPTQPIREWHLKRYKTG